MGARLFTLIEYILGGGASGECQAPAYRSELAGPSVLWPSELSIACPTGRFSRLRRLLGSRGSPAASVGLEAHKQALTVWRAAAFQGAEGIVKALRETGISRASLWAASSALRWLQAGSFPPVQVEPKLPPVGPFSGGRPDLLLGVVPVELAYAEPGGDYWRGKRLVVAAYVLMLEELLEVGVPAAYLVSLKTGYVEKVCVDDAIRREVFERVDLLLSAIDDDPGPPASVESCPSWCPYREICGGGGSGAPARGNARELAQA